jgi:hypothetical protein
MRSLSHTVSLITSSHTNRRMDVPQLHAAARTKDLHAWYRHHACFTHIQPASVHLLQPLWGMQVSSAQSFVHSLAAHCTLQEVRLGSSVVVGAHLHRHKQKEVSITDRQGQLSTCTLQHGASTEPPAMHMEVSAVLALQDQALAGALPICIGAPLTPLAGRSPC